MMYTESEKNANQLIAQIKKTFENADKALQYKKDRQKQYSDLVKSKKESRAFDIMKNNVSEENYIKIKQDQKRSKTEPGKIEMRQLVGRMKKNFKKDLGSSPASGTVQALMMPPALKKDSVTLNKNRDAELMRVNTELKNAELMPAFKPLLIKSASSMGSAPAMMMKPLKDTLKKIKRLRNKAASTVIHSIDTPNPNYGSIKEQDDVPFRYSKNRWLEHVKKCRSEHPEFTYKQALQKCKETYTKK